MSVCRSAAPICGVIQQDEVLVKKTAANQGAAGIRERISLASISQLLERRAPAEGSSSTFPSQNLPDRLRPPKLPGGNAL